MEKKNLKIILSLVIAFFLTKALSTTFFYQEKPKTNQAFFNRLKYHLNKIIKLLDKKIISKRTANASPTPPSNKDYQLKPKKSFFLLPPVSQKTTPKTTPLPTLTPSPSPLLTIITSPKKTLPSAPSPKQIPVKISNSKLGIFVLVNYTPGVEKILSAGPKIIKFIDPQYQPQFIEAVKKYKQNFPQGIVILRFWQGTPGLKYTLNNDPVQSADDFFAKVNQPAFKALNKDISYFDYLQTPNEFETTPEWWGKEKTIWNGKFWRRLTELNKSAGIKTCVGGIPVGNLNASDLGYIIEDLRTIKNLGGAFCYHSYTFTYSTDVIQENQLSLRYRQFYDFFRNNAPDLVNLPLILSEGGVAENGDPKAGYLINQSYERYKNWLKWFDSEIKKDNYVLGVTLFQIGNESDWAYFNLEPMADWLAEYLRNN